MASDPDRPHRRSLRLREYDYSQAGAYFVTVCARGRVCLFGDVNDGEMRLNDAGRIVQEVWEGLPKHYAGLEVDAFVVMPNHVHGIVVLHDHARARWKAAPTAYRAARTPERHGLAEVVRGFKTFSARGINVARNMPGHSLWQRSYYEHVIRNERSLDRIRQYIVDNPAGWATDPENPQATAPEDEDWLA